jgi:hypothetical protein
MKDLFIITVFLTIGWLLFTTGCAANRPYRTGFNLQDPALPGPNATNAVIEAAPAYDLGFVEFDDQGWFWEPKQKQAVEQMIRNVARIGQPAGTPVIMVVFVHGWKNNAAEDNGNVRTFKATLMQLAGLEKKLSQMENRKPRKMIGIYAGWRGLSIKSDYCPLPLGKELTFWGRKAVAQKVGGYGAMTELLMELESLQTASNDSLPADATKSELIIIGHSFGADAVYNAVAHIITERFVATIKQGPGRLLKPVGDQVILLNPAFEAARMYDLKQLALSVKEYSTNQRPVLSVFTSEGDWATGTFFPIGQTLGTLLQSHRSRFQKQSNHEAVGWFAPFITHQLRYQTNAAQASTSGNGTQESELRETGELPNTAQNILSQRRKWRVASTVQTTNVFGDCRLESTPNYRSRNPILVVSVDQQIMKDHDDIGNANLINFLQEYIPFCDNDAPADPAGSK